jgi:serine/threonine protein kinase
MMSDIKKAIDDDAQFSHGAFGSIYELDDAQRRLAIKVFSSASKAHTNAAEDFYDEVAVLDAIAKAAGVTGIEHLIHMTCQWAGVYEHKLFYFYAMPRYTAALSKVSIRSEPAAWQIVNCINRGLAALHALGYVHCDLKGANIFYNAPEDVVIADLGCALRLDARQRASMDDVLCFTNAYVPPEIDTTKRTDEFGTEFDMWSFGVVLVQLYKKRMLEDDYKRISPTWPAAQRAFIADLVDETKNPYSHKTKAETWFKGAEFLIPIVRALCKELPRANYGDVQKLLEEAKV